MWRGWSGRKLAGVSSLCPQLGWALNSGHQAWQQAPLFPAELSCCPHLPGPQGVSVSWLCFSMPGDLAENPDSPTTCKSNRSTKLPPAQWRGKGYCSAGCLQMSPRRVGVPSSAPAVGSRVAALAQESVWLPEWERHWRSV